MSYFCIIYVLISLIIIITSLILISNINSIHRIAYLIFIFILSSLIMITLNFKYLGLTYIIVYVGAIMIIFMFIIMMIDLQDKDIKFTSNIISGENSTLFYFKSFNSTNIKNSNISEFSLQKIITINNKKPNYSFNFFKFNNLLSLKIITIFSILLLL